MKWASILFREHDEHLEGRCVVRLGLLTIDPRLDSADARFRNLSDERIGLHQGI